MNLLQISAWNDSGGGFVNRLLDGHPALRAWPFELLLGRDGVDVDQFGDDWFRSRFRWPRLGELGNADFGDVFDSISDLELKSVLTDPGTAKHAGFDVNVDLAVWRQHVVEACIRDQVTDRAGFINAYIEAFFTLYEPQGVGKTVLGHCPVGILDAPEVWTDFPATRFIHVIRSPLCGFHDMHARHPSLDPAVYALKWSIVNGFAATLAAKYPAAVRLVFLPQLLEAREATMDGLLDWAGLPRSARVYEPSWRGRPIDPSAMGPFGGVPSATALTEQRIPGRLDRQVRSQINEDTRSVQLSLARLAGWTF